MSKPKKKILILGVHLKAEAYPNTLFRLADMKRSEVLEVSEINYPMNRKSLSRPGGFFGKIAMFFSGLAAHFLVIASYIFSRRHSVIYVPYPAVFILFLLSYLSGKVKPKPNQVIADAFISIYDTVVNDRGLLKKSSIIARVLYYVEKRAYNFSTKIVVDTPQGKKFLCSLFHLDDSKVISIPLSTDEHYFKTVKYVTNTQVCRVLFIGTLIPLHGIQTILDAAAILSNRTEIIFKVIGDGQEAARIEHWKLKNIGTLQWERSWLSSAHIAKEIEQADICLGIFGAGNKAQRVCPFKIYAYASVGRPIVTGRTDWTDQLFQQTGEIFFETIAIGDGAALANAILKLANDFSSREKLAAASSKLYAGHLSNSIANQELLHCIFS